MAAAVDDLLASESDLPSGIYSRSPAKEQPKLAAPGHELGKNLRELAGSYASAGISDLAHDLLQMLDDVLEEQPPPLVADALEPPTLVPPPAHETISDELLERPTMRPTGDEDDGEDRRVTIPVPRAAFRVRDSEPPPALPRIPPPPKVLAFCPRVRRSAQVGS